MAVSQVVTKWGDIPSPIRYRRVNASFGMCPSETVGEGNMPFLMSSLDGEKFFVGMALTPAGFALFVKDERFGPTTSPLRTCCPVRRRSRRHAGLLRIGWSDTQEVENGMDRTQKSEVVTTLNATFAEIGVVVVTRNLGMTVAQSTDLRQKMRDAGATFKVTKNRLAKIALKDTQYEQLSDLLTGPIALATSADPVAAAKVAIEFAKTNDKLEIVGGAMGDTLLDAEGVKTLASMPSLDELRAKIVGLIQAPATKLATVIQTPASQLARVFNAYAEKDAA